MRSQAPPQAPPPGVRQDSHDTEVPAAVPAETIEQCIVRNLNEYFANLDGAKPHALHELVLQAAERPLLKFAMARTHGNQSAAAELLGINRNTLRKKLIGYRLDIR